MRPSNTKFLDKGAYTHAEVSTGNSMSETMSSDAITAMVITSVIS